MNNHGQKLNLDGNNDFLYSNTAIYIVGHTVSIRLCISHFLCS